MNIWSVVLWNSLAAIVTYYVFFTCIWIRNLWDGLRRPISQIPRIVDAIKWLFLHSVWSKSLYHKAFVHYGDTSNVKKPLLQDVSKEQFGQGTSTSTIHASHDDSAQHPSTPCVNSGHGVNVPSTPHHSEHLSQAAWKKGDQVIFLMDDGHADWSGLPSRQCMSFSKGEVRSVEQMLTFGGHAFLSTTDFPTLWAPISAVDLKANESTPFLTIQCAQLSNCLDGVNRTPLDRTEGSSSGDASTILLPKDIEKAEIHVETAADNSNRALHVCLAATTLWQMLADIIVFMLGLVIWLGMEWPLDYAMIFILFVVVRLKLLELSLARQHVPELQGKSIVSLAGRFIHRDFTDWERVPEFPFLMGCLNSMTTVSQAIFVVKVMMDAGENNQRRLGLIGLNGLPLPQNMYMWEPVLLTTVMAHIWLLGLVFEPTNKPFHPVMLMELLGLGGLRREYQQAGLHAPQTSSTEFWFTLDITIVRTMGSALPNLWWQHTHQMVHMSSGYGMDFVTTMSMMLSILMVVKQSLRLVGVSVTYLRSYFNRTDRIPTKRESVISWNHLFQIMAFVTIILMICLSASIAKRIFESNVICASRMWTLYDGCVASP
jgi:hypothetical protein